MANKIKNTGAGRAITIIVFLLRIEKKVMYLYLLALVEE
jgi:hypothetical protein